MIFGDISEHDENQLIMLFLTFIVFFFSLTILEFNKSQSYQSYQQINFNHAGETLYANLYYPTNNIKFQEKQPLVIYVHGLGNDRNFDIHFPIELVRRGFFVATLDYHGHGQSGGTIFDINSETGMLAIYEDVSVLLDFLEKLPIYSSSINSSQIGLVGHSLGGAIVLMTSAMDDRINTTVALAPLVNYGTVAHPNFNSNMPVDYINETNIQNLLIMAHPEDNLLNYKQHAQVAAELTNCSLSIHEEPMLGGPHLMLSDEVIEEMITWIEIHFFGFVNGPIITDYLFTYIFLIITIIFLFGIIFLVISLSANFFSFKKIEQERVILKEKIEHSDKEKALRIIGVFLSCILFLIIWILFSNFFRLPGIFYASFLLLIIFSIAYIVLYLKRNKFSLTRGTNILDNIKNRLKQELKVNYFMYGFLASGVFQGFYVVFTVSFPFAFVWPTNLRPFFVGFTIIPIFLSMELFYRSIIYPLLDFIDSESKKSKIIIILSIIIQFLIIYFSRIWVLIPGLILTFLAFLAVIIINTLIYEKNKSMSIRLVFAVDILFFFFGSAITTVIGIDIALYYLI